MKSYHALACKSRLRIYINTEIHKFFDITFNYTRNHQKTLNTHTICITIHEALKRVFIYFKI